MTRELQEMMEIYRKRTRGYLLAMAISSLISTGIVSWLLGPVGAVMVIIPLYAIMAFAGNHREMEMIAGEIEEELYGNENTAKGTNESKGKA